MEDGIPTGEDFWARDCKKSTAHVMSGVYYLNGETPEDGRTEEHLVNDLEEVYGDHFSCEPDTIVEELVEEVPEGREPKIPGKEVHRYMVENYG